MKRIVSALLLTGLILSWPGCIYSFKGGSVPPHLKTISIPLFDDQSGSGEPGLRENFTNKLIESFRQDNSLQLADRAHADAVLEGIIQSVVSTPLVVTTGETLSKQRLTITVKVTYQDVKIKKTVYDKQFSEYGDYDVSGGPAQRQAAITTALDKLTEEILNDTVSGW
jgi:outer membrane lipopolysaccharide assembly protein LptE/RlpB